jgi:hypothetical protein
MTDAFMPAVQPDFFGQLAATDPYQGRARRLFERGQVVAVNGNQADVLVGYDARNNALELKQVPIVSGYVPRIGDWVAMQYEAGHSSAPWITGPSMATDDASDSAGIGVFPVSETEPEDPQRSAVYFDGSQQTWRGWDGAAWVDFAAKLHNSLPDLQGGGPGEYYHLTAAEHQLVVDPNFGGLFDNMPFGPGAVLFADADGHIAHDAADLFWNAAYARLGIGCANPVDILELSKDSGYTLAYLSAFSDTVAHRAGLAFRRGRGSRAASAAVLSGDELGTIYCQGYYGAGVARNVVQIRTNADEDHDGTHGGAYLLFQVIPKGSAALATPLALRSSQAQLLAGSAALPSLTRQGYTDDGIYWPGDGLIGMSIGGAERTRWEAGVYAPVTNEAVDQGKAATRWGNAYCKEVVYGQTPVMTFLVAPGGGISVGANKMGVSMVAPYNATIVRAFAWAEVAPTGQAIIFDLNVNGSTIWSTQANRLQIAAAANSGEQTTFNTTTVSKGDRITVDVDQVGSTTAGANVSVFLQLLKTGSIY